ncbi:MAG: shewanella-like protein phosphatase [Byssovorax sp.]
MGNDSSTSPPRSRGALAGVAAIGLAGAAIVYGTRSSAPNEPAPAQVAPPSARASAPPSPSAAPEPLARVPAPARLVAIGDLHGDLAATRAALRLGGAIDEQDHWAGGDLVVVQTGDQLDRGDDERKILDLLERLSGEAKEKGGALHALNGNHEVMNVALDFRYVTDGGFSDFAGVPGALSSDPRLASLPERARPRAAALLPGAPYAKLLARRQTIAMVGDTLFVHGGVLPKHVAYGLARINREVSAWMNGESKSPPSIVTADDAPIWTRRYSDNTGPDDCKALDEALAAAGAKRMVVGHTVQQRGINGGCGDKVWRIDVGLSHHYGGKPQVLEIKGDAVKVLSAPQ